MISQIWDRRIPTLLGIGLIAFSVILTSIFIKNPTSLSSKAYAADEPQNVTLTNISDTSFVLSYTTGEAVIGTINFGQNTNLGTTEIEDIDRQKAKISPHMIHVTTFNNLTPNTKYYFAINSGLSTYLKNNLPFEITTGPKIPASKTFQTAITGNIILPDGSIPKQVIAYLTINGAQTLSTLADKNGSFSFDTDSIRSEDLSSQVLLSKDSNIKITFTSDSYISRVLSLYNQTNPLPTITMSNNYDFTLENIVSNGSVSNRVGGFQQILPTLPPEKQATETPIIIVPKKDQRFINLQPQFRGTSLPNEKIDIIIHSPETITGEVTADSYGNWTFSPPKNLTPGSHTLTIKTKNALGIVKTIRQSFVVYASENLTPAPATDSAIPSPTITITVIPTQISTQEIISISQMPPTGNSNIFLIGITAIVITVIGLVLFLSTRSKTSL